MFTQVQVTKHARERYIERTNKKFAHLIACKNNRKGTCPVCVNLAFDLSEQAEKDKVVVNNKIVELLNESHRIKSVINNTGLIQYYYEKYGYESNFEFYLNGNMLFIVLQRDEKKIILTCINDKNHAVAKMHSKRPNFKKKEIIYV